LSRKTQKLLLLTDIFSWFFFYLFFSFQFYVLSFQFQFSVRPILASRFSFVSGFGFLFWPFGWFHLLFMCILMWKIFLFRRFVCHVVATFLYILLLHEVLPVENLSPSGKVFREICIYFTYCHLDNIVMQLDWNSFLFCFVQFESWKSCRAISTLHSWPCGLISTDFSSAKGKSLGSNVWICNITRPLSFRLTIRICIVPINPGLETTVPI